jgi:Mrp family chromosome partitioning ATPase
VNVTVVPTQATLDQALDAALGVREEIGPRGFVRRGPREALGRPEWDQGFFDSCRRSLHALVGGPNDRGVVQVLSPRRGDGRSTVAAAMAVSLGLTYGEGVALLDLDFAKGELATLFRIAPAPGLADYLEDRQPLRAVAGGPVRQLCLIPAGRPQADPVALYRSLIERGILPALRKRFRWIVMDLPPLLAEPGAAWLGAFGEWHVLVGKYRKTTLPELEEMADMVDLGRGAAFLLTGDTSRIPAFIRRMI